MPWDFDLNDGVSCSSLSSCSSSLESGLGDSELGQGLRDSEPESDGDSLHDEVAWLEGLPLCHGDSKRRRLTKNVEARHCGLSHAFAHRAKSSEVTLIILDWDDTLLPSTWLQMQGLHISSAPPDEAQGAELRRVARCVIKTLRRAKRLGHVIIVTNGERGWVELSCRKFLPEVAPLLEAIKILSARSAFEHMQPTSPVYWKRMAFQAEIGDFFKAHPMLADVDCHGSMVSVGDSMQERTALMEATEGRGCWAKSLKLIERPSPDQLVKQHELLRDCLRPFVHYEGSLDMCLEVPICPAGYNSHLH